MAIPALSLDQVLAMDVSAYFEQYARYFADSPNAPYAIRIGSKTLFSNDTMDLRQKLTRLLAAEKRKRTRAANIRKPVSGR
jgi:hypothetical protein